MPTPDPSAAARRLERARATLEASAQCEALAPQLADLVARDAEAKRAGERARKARDRAAAEAQRAAEARRLVAAEARALLLPVVQATGQATLVAQLTGVPPSWLSEHDDDPEAAPSSPPSLAVVSEPDDQDARWA